MTRADVIDRLPAMPPQMRKCVEMLLEGPQSSVDFYNAFCLSARTQISKARDRYSVPIIGEPTEGSPCYTYRLVLDEEEVRHEA